jgi:EpsI family protein
MISNVRFYVLVALLSMAVLLMYTISHGERAPMRKDLKNFPRTIGSWVGTDLAFSEHIVDVLGVQNYLHRSYRADDAALWFYVGYYQSQREGRAIHSPKNCLPGAGWNIIASEAYVVRLSDGNHVTINKDIIQKGLEKQLVFYWYQSGGRVIASEYWGKVYLIIDAATRHRTDGALIRISIPFKDSHDEALQRGVEFIRLIWAHLSEFIPN